MGLDRVGWDAIVIGTGMGGAVAGHTLAAKGLKVLFCERGQNTDQKFVGDFAESFLFDHSNGTPHEILAKAGRYTHEILDTTGPRSKHLFPLLGSGPGGSTALFGMVLERFFDLDFDSGWPITGRALEPHYLKLERSFGIRGQADPLKNFAKIYYAPPLPLSERASNFFTYFKEQGLHPYRLPLAHQGNENCRYCQGFLCDKACKHDAYSTFVEPAIKNHGAGIAFNCEITRIRANHGYVTGLEAIWNGTPIQLKAQVIILAAGALSTPQLLLNSASFEHPNGIANRSGLVGRNLMRHLVDLYAVHGGGDLQGQKALGFSDFYIKSRLGTVQSFGRLPHPRIIVAGIAKELREDKSHLKRLGFSLARGLVQSYLSREFGRSVLFASTLEDRPNLENRILVNSNGKLELKYRISDEDKVRLHQFRKSVGKLFDPFGYTRLKMAEENKMLAHACGTCRFGNDPKTSVVNAAHCSHELMNLFIVDASVFPSSGGTNPALTIGALSLRAAEQIIETWQQRQPLAAP